MCITNCKFNCIYRKLFYFIVNYFGCGLNFCYNYYSEAVFYAFWVIFSRCVLRGNLHLNQMKNDIVN